MPISAVKDLHDHHQSAEINKQPESTAVSVSAALMHVAPFCVNCSEAIFDQYFLCVADQAWHCQCLKCSECGLALDPDQHMTCYYKDGRILCKDDYYRKCRDMSTKCSGCNFTIASNELVMKIRQFVFHLACFRCRVCSEELHTGDEFGMRDNGLIYCRQHYHQECIIRFAVESETNVDPTTTTTGSPNTAAACENRLPQDAVGCFNQHASNYLPLLSMPNDNCNAVDYFAQYEHKALRDKKQIRNRPRRRKNGMSSFHMQLSTGPGQQGQADGNSQLVSQSLADHLSSPHSDRQLLSNSLIQLVPCHVSSSSTESSPCDRTEASSPTDRGGHCGLLSRPSAGMQLGSQQSRLHAPHSASTTARSVSRSQRDSSSPSCSVGPGSTGGGGGGQHQQRTKRMRTSFKHQQLRAMKQYFQINHNPDAKDLKQLAQKTGLTKRVLQVWFQNARAKYRRSLLKQVDGNCVGNESPSEKSLIMSPAAHSAHLESNSPCSSSFVNSLNDLDEHHHHQQLASLKDTVLAGDMNHYPNSNGSCTNTPQEYY